MKTFLNIIWHIPFFGFLSALMYALVGCLFCITIVGLPIGLGLLQFSKFLLWPHGNKMVNKADLHELKETTQNPVWKVFALIVRILYFPFGLLGAISCIFTIVAEFISIIGIPSGLVWAKSLGTIFNPVNKVCVPEFVALEIERKKQERYLRRNSMTNTSIAINTAANNVPPPMPHLSKNEAILPPPLPPLLKPVEHTEQDETTANVSQIVAALAVGNRDPKVVISLPEEEKREVTEPENIISTELEEITSFEAPDIVEETTEELSSEIEEEEAKTVAEIPEESVENTIEAIEIANIEAVEIPPMPMKETEEIAEENVQPDFGYIKASVIEETVYMDVDNSEVVDNVSDISSVVEAEISAAIQEGEPEEVTEENVQPDFGYIEASVIEETVYMDVDNSEVVDNVSDISSVVEIEMPAAIEEPAVEPVFNTVDVSEEVAGMPDNVTENRVSEGIIESYETIVQVKTPIATDEVTTSNMPPPLPKPENKEAIEAGIVNNRHTVDEQPKKESIAPPTSENAPVTEPVNSAVQPTKKKSSKKTILIAVLALVILAGGTAAFVILPGSSGTEPEPVASAEAYIESTANEEEPLVKQDDIEELAEEAIEPDIIEAMDEPVSAVVEVAATEKPVVEKPAKETPANTSKTPEKTTVAPPSKTVKETPVVKPVETAVPAAPAPHPKNGTKNYPSGTVYTGDFNAAGLRHGRGNYTWASGDRYEGNWINDKATGQGTYYSREGWKYVGQFVDLKFHGEGIYYFANGKSRKGKWLNGQMQK